MRPLFAALVLVGLSFGAAKASGEKLSFPPLKASKVTRDMDARLAKLKDARTEHKELFTYYRNAGGGYAQQPDKVVEDMPTAQPVEAAQRRVLRGGAFGNRPEFVRSADRTNYAFHSDDRSINVGFRPARTYR